MDENTYFSRNAPGVPESKWHIPMWVLVWLGPGLFLEREKKKREMDEVG